MHGPVAEALTLAPPGTTLSSLMAASSLNVQQEASRNATGLAVSLICFKGVLRQTSRKYGMLLVMATWSPNRDSSPQWGGPCWSPSASHLVAGWAATLADANETERHASAQEGPESSAVPGGSGPGAFHLLQPGEEAGGAVPFSGPPACSGCRLTETNGRRSFRNNFLLI